MTNEERARIIDGYKEFEDLNFPQVLEAQALRRPDKVFLVDGERRFTFKEFNDAVNDAGAALMKQGLKRGEPLALLYPNNAEYLIFQFAVMRMGALLIPFNTRYRIHEIEFRLNFSDCRFLVMVDKYLKADFTDIVASIRPGLPKLEKVFVKGERREGMLDVEELLRYKATPEERAAVMADPVKNTTGGTILFTSGTTAMPKGVVLSHRARVFTGIRLCERMRIVDGDVILNFMPLCHEFGGFTIVSHALVSGCKMVLMEMFNAEEALRLIPQEKVSVIYGVPTMFSYMFASPMYEKTDFSSFRTGYMSGAACPLELVKRVQEDMHCNIAVAYGLSEAPSHTISEYDVPAEVKAATVGKPIRDAEVRIMDDNRKPLPVNTPGEIAIKGNNLLNEYFKRPDITAASFDQDGFFYTKDLGTLDETGYVHFMGRKDDMIVSGGFNVYPVEIEEVLYQLPFVEHAGVVGFAHPELGETVYACIVAKKGTNPTAAEVIDFCKSQLANYKVPRVVKFWDELPVTEGTTKIKKSEIVRLLKEGK